MGGGLIMGQKTSFVQLRPTKLLSMVKRADKQDLHSLYLSLGGIMGAGNIAGVAVAIKLGGPGAVLWMCISAIVCSSLKYGEIYAAVKYTGIQNKLSDDSFGPLCYIRRIPKASQALGGMFCIVCALSAFTTGGMIQANAVSEMLCNNQTALFSGAVLFTLVTIAVSLLAKDGAVKFCTAVVPFMTIVYLFTCVIVMLVNSSKLPGVFFNIVVSAFGFEDGNRSVVWGGVSGIVLSMRRGFSVGLLSHESGLGTAAIAHSIGKQKNPGVCASLGIIEVYVDTLIGGLFTALCLLVTDKNSASAAFESVFGVSGQIIVTVTLVFFALSSCVTWFYYGKRAVATIKRKYIPVYIITYCVFVFAAFFVNAPWAYMMSDASNALMAGINVVSLLWVSKQSKMSYSIDSASLSRETSTSSERLG